MNIVPGDLFFSKIDVLLHTNIGWYDIVKNTPVFIISIQNKNDFVIIHMLVNKTILSFEQNFNDHLNDFFNE